jgi:hypothetical protein
MIRTSPTSLTSPTSQIVRMSETYNIEHYDGLYNTHFFGVCGLGGLSDLIDKKSCRTDYVQIFVYEMWVVIRLFGSYSGEVVAEDVRVLKNRSTCPIPFCYHSPFFHPSSLWGGRRCVACVQFTMKRVNIEYCQVFYGFIMCIPTCSDRWDRISQCSFEYEIWNAVFPLAATLTLGSERRRFTAYRFPYVHASMRYSLSSTDGFTRGSESTISKFRSCLCRIASFRTPYTVARV